MSSRTSLDHTGLCQASLARTGAADLQLISSPPYQRTELRAGQHPQLLELTQSTPRQRGSLSAVQPLFSLPSLSQPSLVTQCILILYQQVSAKARFITEMCYDLNILLSKVFSSSTCLIITIKTTYFTLLNSKLQLLFQNPCIIKTSRNV